MHCHAHAAERADLFLRNFNNPSEWGGCTTDEGERATSSSVSRNLPIARGCLIVRVQGFIQRQNFGGGGGGGGGGGSATSEWVYIAC